MGSEHSHFHQFLLKKTCNYTMAASEPSEKRAKDGIAECCKMGCIGWGVGIHLHFLLRNDGLIFCKRNDESFYEAYVVF